MILDYHRPDSIEQALELLARPEPQTRPLGGGSVLNAPSDDRYDVVDLQLLKLDKIVKKGSSLQVGATATLQALMENAHIPAALHTTIRSEAARNLRQVATVAGTLVSADGRSPFATACLALDAVVMLQPGDDKINYGDLLPLRGDLLPKRLITSITLPLQVSLAYHYVARSPADLPIVSVALAAWPSGRYRLALGGFGPAPILALDGKDAPGLLPAVENAFSQSQDEWASAEYRLEIARILTDRCLADVERT